MVYNGNPFKHGMIWGFSHIFGSTPISFEIFADLDPKREEKRVETNHQSRAKQLSLVLRGNDPSVYVAFGGSKGKGSFGRFGGVFLG